MIWRLVLLLACLCPPVMARAECDLSYRVQPGDTLFSIAASTYRKAEDWTLIYYANQDVLEGTEFLPAGLTLYIPCAAATAGMPAHGAAQDEAELRLLAGGGFAPFADQSWPDQGLAVELVTRALDLSPSPLTFEVSWDQDRGRHFFPLLDEKAHDMGLPLMQPDCAAEPDAPVCQRFHFSEPLFELPVMLFVLADQPFAFESDADLPGKRLCRPAGYPDYDLDRPDRRWLSEGRIVLIRPETPEACFEALLAGEVDAVTLDLYQGTVKLLRMGLRGQIVPVPRPLSREALRVAISRTHWRGTTHLYRVNAGLEALRDSGAYDEIVARHLAMFWEQVR